MTQQIAQGQIIFANNSIGLTDNLQGKHKPILISMPAGAQLARWFVLIRSFALKLLFFEVSIFLVSWVVYS